MKSEQFEFKGRLLDVVANIEGESWIVTVRENGHTVGRMEYRAATETVQDAALASNSIDLVGEMMKIARRDVEDDIVGIEEPFS